MGSAGAVPTAAGCGETGTARVLQIINDGWLVLLLSIGEQIGLLEYLDRHGPVDLDMASHDTRVPLRYLKEWSWAMVAGGLVQHEAAAGTFALSPGFGDALTASGGPTHWSRIAEQIVAFAGLEGELLARFRNGGGIGPETYEGRIQEVMDLESGAIFDRLLLSQIVPAINMAPSLDAGIDVVDFGCGSGKLLTTLAGAFPKSRFLGVDISASALARAEGRSQEAGLPNCHFKRGDLEPLELDARFDLAFCCNTAHDLAFPATFFKAVFDRLRADGVCVLQELTASSSMTENARNPLAPGILAFSLFHCVPLALNKADDAIAPGGMWGREHYVAALRDAGFADISVIDIAEDRANDLIVARRPPRAPGSVGAVSL